MPGHRRRPDETPRLHRPRAEIDQIGIDVAIVDSVPLGVDTSEDLEIARAMLKSGR